MIIVEFQGGLGNQMFQYAFFEELKYMFPNVEILADTFDYGKSSFRSFELSKAFGIHLPKARKIDIMCMTDKVPGHPYATVIRRKVEKALYGKDYLSKIHCMYKCFENSDPVEIDGNCDLYLSGWWQNEKCFFDVRNRVVDAFSSESVSMGDYIADVQNDCSVSVHVRRGDYLNYPEFNILSLDYYREAIAYISSRVKNPIFVFFSDDKEFIKKEFGFIRNKVIMTENDGDNSFKDLLLMSKCKHNVIANSTFSWWGAYLNKNPDKIVVAPSRYSNNGRVNLQSADSWVQIEV